MLCVCIQYLHKGLVQYHETDDRYQLEINLSLAIKNKFWSPTSGILSHLCHLLAVEIMFKLCNLTAQHFLYLDKVETYGTFLIELFQELNGLIFAKCLEQCLADSKYSMNVSTCD